MSIGLKMKDMVPSGMLGTQQWYSRPEMQQQLQLEMEVMKPHVGEIKWGVNVGTLPDGRMYWKVRQPIKAERANGRGTLYNNVYDILLVNRELTNLCEYVVSRQFDRVAQVGICN